MTKKISESPHPLKNIRPLKNKNNSEADKKVTFSTLENFATNARTPPPKTPLPTANCVIVIVTKLVSVSKSKVGDYSRGLPEGSLFNSYYTVV